MPKARDITGERFGRLLALRLVSREKGVSIWEFQCDCGNTIERKIKMVTSPSGAKSCGCLQSENAKRQLSKLTRTTHSMSKSKEYIAWKNMKARCLDVNHQAFYNYGGRGIKVCDAWINSFESFYEDMGDCPPDLTLDRANNEGNYEPSNCRWATRGTQATNKRKKRNCSSKYIGINWCSQMKKWKATYRGTHVGYFTEEIEAHNARLKYGETNGKA